MKVLGVILIIVGIFTALVVCETLINNSKAGKSLTDEQKKDTKNTAIISIMCFLVAVACFVAGTFTKIILLLALFIFCIVGFSNSLEREKQQKVQKQLEEEHENVRKEKEEEKMKETIIEFAKKNGVILTYTYNIRDICLNRALSDLIVSSAPIYEPAYTKGAVSGSLADNISIIANQQKKKQYDELIQGKRGMRRTAIEAKREYEEKAREIITELKKIPNSETYVQYEEEQLAYNMSVLNKLLG